MVHVSPQKRLEALEKICKLDALSTFRVTGEADVFLIVEQQELDSILEELSTIEGVLQTRSYVAIGSH
jgi:UDP-N-acetylenolpyruvoylglucosamine reductase